MKLKFDVVVETVVILIMIGVVFAGVYVAFDSRFEMLEKQKYFDDVSNNDTDKIA